MSARFAVAFYAIDRQYGGPEEGGWWYNTGSLIRIARLFTSEDLAFEYASRANRLLDLCNRRLKYGVSSVIYSGGAVSASVYEGVPPQHFPEERPHYE